MKTTKEQAIEVAIKAVKDIGFWGEDMGEPNARFDDGKVLFPGVNLWMVSFYYGADDYGPNNASMGVSVLDEEGMAVNVSYRNGYVQLGYNDQKESYFIKEQRP